MPPYDERAASIVWTHIPKCGSSFMMAIVRVACPDIPSSASGSCAIDYTLPYRQYNTRCSVAKAADARPYCSAEGERPLREGKIYGIVPSFWLRWPAGTWCRGGFNGLGNGHVAIPGDAKDAYLGNVVTMLRAPRQRLLSAFHDGEHACQHKYPIGQVWTESCNAATFARALGSEACQAYLLTDCAYRDTSLYPAGGNYKSLVQKADRHNQAIHHCRNRHKVVEEAKRRLRKFAFFGLLEEWELSVRLFHLGFGNPYVYDNELLTLRQGGQSTSSTAASPTTAACTELYPRWYDEAELEVTDEQQLTIAGLVPRPISELDPVDTEVYAFAVPIFFERAVAASLLSEDEAHVRERCLLELTGSS